MLPKLRTLNETLSYHGSDESDYCVGKTSCLHLPKNLQCGEGEEVGRRNRKVGTKVKLEWQEEEVEME
jgi:hypothetical protein